MAKYNEIKPEKTTGGVTLPAESGHEDTVRELIQRWGADVIRDCDGTALSPELEEMGLPIYSTICIVRADQEWAHAHMDQVPQKYLMSVPVTSDESGATIHLMNSWCREKYRVDTDHDPKEWWQVIDRSTGETVSEENWSYDADSGNVTLSAVPSYHSYTVNFLVYIIWDTTSMYNHIVNDWDRPHVISVDPYHKETWDHLMAYYDRWIEEHPNTSLVRLTSLAYHFTVDADEKSDDKFRDWYGYQETLSVPAMLDFEKEYGYRMLPEDFVDEGYHNAVNRVPSERYRDWMDFMHRFVTKFGKALVDKAHAAGKTAGVFWGDHWIGMEPYLDSFQETGMDMQVTGCEDGVALRRLADVPGPQTIEMRLYPYFFPDVFKPGGDPTAESIDHWIKIRRALLRSPLDRMGYGGYLSLVAEFPDFVDHVADLCNEFRSVKTMTGNSGSYIAPVKVAVLNAWGKRRSWLNSFGREQKFLIKRPDLVLVAGTNLLECLSGLPVEVEFISFEDILEGGIPADVDVIINDGDEGTAWSGGRYWADPRVTAEVRRFVHEGGGFIGCRGPSAIQHQGQCFQLTDVLGVEKENSLRIQANPLTLPEQDSHFITADTAGDLGTPESFVYPCDPTTKVLRKHEGHVLLSAKDCGEGRGVYMAALPYELENCRLLYRAILWSAHKENELTLWYSENMNTDCAAFPESNCFAVTNNVDSEQMTTLYDGQGDPFEVTLSPYEMKWFGEAL